MGGVTLGSYFVRVWNLREWVEKGPQVRLGLRSCHEHIDGFPENCHWKIGYFISQIGHPEWAQGERHFLREENKSRLFCDNACSPKIFDEKIFRACGNTSAWKRQAPARMVRVRLETGTVWIRCYFHELFFLSLLHPFWEGLGITISWFANWKPHLWPGWPWRCGENYRHFSFVCACLK